MRRVVSMLLCCVAMALPIVGKAQTKHKGAHIKFEQTEIDFGTVSRNGENKRCVFRFTNDGTEPLVVLSATTSCSCVKTKLLRKPLAPGEKGEIELLIEVRKMDKGIFHRIVQVRSNSVGGTENLVIKGKAKD